MIISKEKLQLKQNFFKSMLLFSIILMDLLSGMEFDLFVPSFPELQSQFELSPFWVEALLSVNFIGYCLSLVFVGGMADRYGRKPVIVLGLAVFVIGSLLCLCVPFYYFLLAGRFLQGLGVAAPAVLSFLIIADMFALKKQQFLFAIINGVMNFSVAIAPVVGSYIALYFHWQGNFVALLLIGFIVLAMTIFFIPRHTVPNITESVVQAGYSAILKSRSLMLLIANIAFGMVPYWIFVGVSPLLYMKNFNVSLSRFGLYQGALAFVFAVGSILYGLVMNRYDQKKMLSIANVIFVLSFLLIAFAVFSNTKDPIVITSIFLSFTIGQVIPSVILYPLSLNLLPHIKGRVSAIIQMARLLLSSFSLQLVGYYYQGSFQSIGIIIMGFIMVVIVTLGFILKNRELMKALYK